MRTLLARHWSSSTIDHTDAIVPGPDPIVVHVLRGAVDLFVSELVDGNARGRWLALCRLTPGMRVVLVPVDRGTPGMLARACPGAQVLRFDRGSVRHGEGSSDDAMSPIGEARRAEDESTAAGIDAALQLLSGAMCAELPPRQFAAIEGSGSIVLQAGVPSRSVDGVRWIIDSDAPLEVSGFGGQRVWRAGSAVCLTEQDWIIGSRTTSVVSEKTSGLVGDDGFIDVWVGAFAHITAQLPDYVASIEAADDRIGRRLWESTEHAQQSSRKAVSAHGPQAVHAEPLVDACNALARHVGLRGVEQPARPAGADLSSWCGALGQYGLFGRRVRLRHGWSRNDLGPMLGVLDSGEPIALCRSKGTYVFHDPVLRVDRKVGTADEQGIRSEALAVTPSLPDSVRTPVELLGWASAAGRRDLALYGVMSAAAVGVGLAVPVVTGRVVGEWLGRGDRSLLLGGVALVVLIALMGAVLTFVQQSALIRFQGRVELHGQGALLEKTLGLPAEFFRRYTASEMATIGLTLSTARETASGFVGQAAMALVVATANLLLILVVAPPAGVVAAAVTAVFLLAFRGVFRRTLASGRRVYFAERKYASLSLQLLSGIGVLRLAGATDRAFVRWVGWFDRFRSEVRDVRRSYTIQTCANALLGPAFVISLFALAGSRWWADASMSSIVTSILAATAAAGSLTQFASIALSLAEVVPSLEQVGVMLAEDREPTPVSHGPFELSGRVELRDVTFSYGGHARPTIERLSFSVEPGQFVAIVGPTGSGKSTIIRLLLGFESPTTGSISFDGRALSSMSAGEVRRQCGVVLQSSHLFPGDVLSNICGGTSRTLSDAWAAAELAGIADDIRALPMGMFTYIGEGGGSFSGGQAQRLLIARALVSSPRLLLLDEATSALDNVSQQLVAASIHKMNTTRIVVAHRLSTVQAADRILVLDQGRIVQDGSFADLAADEDGAFAMLVGRQMT